jgi:hypothetical protein
MDSQLGLTAGIRRLAEARSGADREGQVACMPLLGRAAYGVNKISAEIRYSVLWPFPLCTPSALAEGKAQLIPT